MANNRIYLRCKGCGKEFFLGKRFGGGYFISQYEKYKGVSLMERLNKFYDDHEWCGNAGLDCFELRYEDPPQPQTNADRIRAMSDEELAEFLDDVRDGWGCSYYPHFVEDWLDWLKQESET